VLCTAKLEAKLLAQSREVTQRVENYADFLGRTHEFGKLFFPWRFRCRYDMKQSRLDNLGWIATGVLVLAGCGSQTVPRSIGGQAPAQVSHSKSWMLPEATGEDLIYALGGCDGICVISYPALKVVGSLPLVAGAACSDARGNVFFAGLDKVTEYAHGGTQPIAILNLQGDDAFDCAVDPQSNDLAVVYEGNYGDVAVFTDRHRKRTNYDSHLASRFCGYDSKGNLFVDGYYGLGFGLSELPKYAGAFTPFALPNSVGYPGQIQWDGKYIAYQGLGSVNTISRIAVSGSTETAIVVETVNIKVRRHMAPSWLYDGNVVVPYRTHNIYPKVIGVFKYPTGGAATKTIRKFPPYKNRTLDFHGVTVSVAPSR
jgi:hypothetical protein